MTQLPTWAYALILAAGVMQLLSGTLFYRRRRRFLVRTIRRARRAEHWREFRKENALARAWERSFAGFVRSKTLRKFSVATGAALVAYGVWGLVWH